MISVCVKENDRMGRKKVEGAHLIVAPLSKKLNNNHKKFKPHLVNKQSNTYNPSKVGLLWLVGIG